jgi:hypothetical protein
MKVKSCARASAMMSVAFVAAKASAAGGSAAIILWFSDNIFLFPFRFAQTFKRC